MTILLKNTDEETFLKGLDYCIENNYLTIDDKEAAIQAGGITMEQWEKITTVIREGWGLGLGGRLVQLRLDQQLIHPDYSNFKKD